jgi:3-deoxy-D-manno-octulosonate 8-phosphate phosphatase (KDO 8-P phosphatase)
MVHLIFKKSITDVDGCLTDGKAYYSADKEIEKNFSIQDGFMITKCNKPNMPYIAFVTGRSDMAATKRAKVLGIPDELYYQGVNSNKAAIVEQVQKKLSLSKDETLFFGDDILDLKAKCCAEVFASPSNGIFYLRDNADIVVPRVGGDGAFRLLLDLLLYVQEKHITQDYIKKSIEK